MKVILTKEVKYTSKVISRRNLPYNPLQILVKKSRKSFQININWFSLNIFWYENKNHPQREENSLTIHIHTHPSTDQHHNKKNSNWIMEKNERNPIPYLTKLFIRSTQPQTTNTFHIKNHNVFVVVFGAHYTHATNTQSGGCGGIG